MTGNLTSFAAAVASTDGGVRINTRERRGMTVFHKRSQRGEPPCQAAGRHGDVYESWARSIGSWNTPCPARPGGAVKALMGRLRPGGESTTNPE